MHYRGYTSHQERHQYDARDNGVRVVLSPLGGDSWGFYVLSDVRQLSVFLSNRQVDRLFKVRRDFQRTARALEALAAAR